MPSSEIVRTKSAHKYVAGVLFIVLVLALMIFITSRATAPTLSPVIPQQRDHSTVQMHVKQQGFPEVRYELMRANNEAAKEKGLSGRPSMAPNAGMLFPYAAMEEQCFWMRDMKYSLDIIWLDRAKRVVHIEKNLAPETYPATYCATAQYVIELNAGETTRTGIKTGAVLSF